MTVKILKFTEDDRYVTFGEDLKLTYKDHMSGLRKVVLASEKNRNAALESLCKGLQSASIGSDDLNAFHLPEAGKFNNFYKFIFFICLAKFSFDLGL